MQQNEFPRPGSTLDAAGNAQETQLETQRQSYILEVPLNILYEISQWLALSTKLALRYVANPLTQY